jgi:D-erythronate 2-dehydrogenase
MKVLITGGGGFLDYRLARPLLEHATLPTADGSRAAIARIRLLDAAFPPEVNPRLECITGDIPAPA